jgi:23S rRNA (uracil1939-C5)-methyltransferase
LRLNIEKLIYGGDGLSRLPPGPEGSAHSGRGKAVFIPFVLPGETVEASIIETKPGFARAKASAILEPSPHRITPECPYFSSCGGCHYQHIGYEQQLEIKKEILRENLRRIARLDLQSEIIVHSSPPWNYRNRSRLQIRTDPDFAIGYFKFASHELLPVEQCPISSPLINRAIAALWQIGRAGSHVRGIQEIEFLANADDAQLLVEIQCTPDARRAATRSWAEEMQAALPEVAGVVAFRQTAKRLPEPFLTTGSPQITYRTRNSAFRVSAGSFFQTNRFLTDTLIDIVTAQRSGDLAVDLYAGVGLFSTALACDFRHIVSVESSQTAASDLAYNLPTNGKAVHSAVEQYLSAAGAACADAGSWLAGPHSDVKPGRGGTGNSPRHHLHTPDLIVVDPPRNGLGDRVARLLATVKAPRLTYISCDPATLARDLVPLQAAAYRVEEVHLVDLFPQTFHIESIVHLIR